MSTDDMARDVYRVWHDCLDLGDPEFEEVREAAERIAEDESYRSAFGAYPKRDEAGRVIPPVGTCVHAPTRGEPEPRGPFA